MATSTDSRVHEDESPDDTSSSSGSSPEPAPSDSSSRPKVFLAYRESPEGTSLAEGLYRQLEDRYEITFARQMPAGIEWPLYTQKRLEEAEFFVVLMTQDACDSSRSDYLPYEIDIAAQLYLKRSSPVIIPVRVAHLEPYDYRIGAHLARFQEIRIEDPENIADLVGKVRAALERRTPPLRDTFGTALAPYLPPELTHLCLAASSIELPALLRARGRLEAGNTVWFTGEAGVRNYAVRSLAAAGGAKNVYWIPNTKSWSDVEKTLVGKATIVFLDALPSSFLSEDTAVEQFAALARLLSRENRILLTAPDDAFEEARLLMQRFEFRHFHHERLIHQSYSFEGKRRILETSLDVLTRSGQIGQRQLILIKSLLAPKEDAERGRAPRQGLTEEVRQRLEQALEKWTPSDVESFLLHYLPDISRLADLARILQRNATLEDEIHAWFGALPDSAKCFVLTVALIPGLGAPRTWDKHKKIFQKLRGFDPGLALWPLGLSRERSAPYMTQDGPLGFSEERIAAAVRREIARSYREYLVELVPELKQWTLGGETSPPDLSQVRVSVATMIGDAARVSLDDVLSLLQAWAGHGEGEVRELAALAMERFVADASAQEAAFGLLARWSGDQETIYHVWAAIAAYGRIAAMAPGGSASRRALERLADLALDERNRVADKVSLAARKLAPRYPIEELAELFQRLAHHGKPFVRLNLADAVNAVRLANEEAGEEFFRKWRGADDGDLRWVAACSLILQGGDQRWRRVAADTLNALWEVLSTDGVTLADALCEAVEDEYCTWRALATLERLAGRGEKSDSPLLARSVAAALVQRKDRTFLPVLRMQGRRFNRLLIAIRVELWSGLLGTPDALVSELEAESRQQEGRFEALEVMAALVGTEGLKRQLIGALASRWADQHEPVEQILSWLRNAHRPDVAGLSIAVRRRGLATFLQQPKLFVGLVHGDLQHPERRPETRTILSEFAQPEPAGSQSRFVEALATVHPEKTEPVEDLLAVFKVETGSALAQVARMAMLRICQNLLERPMDLVSELKRMRSGGRIWIDALNALDHLVSFDVPNSRRKVVKAFATAERLSPFEMRALLKDDGFRSRNNLRYLWLRVRVEVILRTLLLSND